MDLVRKLILEKLAEAGLTMSEASVKIGRNHAYLQQFLKRQIPKELGEYERSALANLLKVPEDELRGTSPPLPKREYVRVNGTSEIKSGTAHNSLDRASPIPPVFGDRDLPVFGTAQGGVGGALIVTSDPVDYVLRPAPLLRVRDGYGIIVTGDSMSPEHKSGSTALVNPHLPPRVGDTCIFRRHDLDGTVHCIIKELRGETEALWKVRQHNPKKDFTLKKSEWQVVHKTIGNYFA